MATRKKIPLIDETATLNVTGAVTIAGSGSAVITFPATTGTLATVTQVDAKVADSITDGVTTIAPSQNAVFDALAGKQASLTFGIADTNAVKVTVADVATGEYARFNTTGLESRTTTEVLSDIGAQAALTFGIAQNNAVKVSAADVATGEYAKFTTTGLESKTTSEVLSDIGAITASSTETLTNKTLTDPKITTSINAQTGTTYTLALTDNCKLVTLDNTGAITVTIPTNATVAFPIGARVDLCQIAAGKVTIGGTDVTINSKGGNKAIGAQWVAVSLFKTATDTWLLVGDLIA